MPRTDEDLVAGVVEIDTVSIKDLDPYIESAAILVDEEIAPLGVLSEARLELIERWLAGHFYAVRDQRASTERADVVSVSYQHKVDLGLHLTPQGQQALVLDSTGTLARLNAQANSKESEKPKTTVASIKWLGMRY